MTDGEAMDFVSVTQMGKGGGGGEFFFYLLSSLLKESEREKEDRI
jgi:hypothetical protein